MTDLVTAFRSYAFKMLKSPAVEGMKALLLDEETSKMFGLTVSLSEAIKEDVVIVGKLVRGTGSDATGTSIQEFNYDGKLDRHSTAHLKCVVMLRPTRASVQALCQQLKTPQFQSYYVFFTNAVPDELLFPLANADWQHELVRQVHVFFCDFFVLEPRLFIGNAAHVAIRYLSKPRDYWPMIVEKDYQRDIEMVLSIILTLKVLPTLHATRQGTTQEFLTQLSRHINGDQQLYRFKQNGFDDCVLLCVDRRDDPLTPLLLNWSYYAMVNELLPLENNRVDLRGVPGIDPELKEVTLSTQQDVFFNTNIYSGFGDIAKAARQLVQQYQQQKTAATGKMETLDDIRSAIERVPELKIMAGTVTKHMAILTELSRQVKIGNLFEVSKLQQDVTCENNHTGHVESIRQHLANEQIRFDSKLCTVLLYAVKYEQEPNSKLEEFRQTLLQRYPQYGFKIKALDAIIQQCGQAKRAASAVSLSHGRSLFGKVSSYISSGVKGYENVHTRHKPLILDIITNITQGTARMADLPVVPTNINPETHANGTGPNHEFVPKPSTIVVFMLGGVTIAEAAAVAQFNQQNNGIKVILGGTHVINTQTFLNNLIGNGPSQTDGSAAFGNTYTDKGILPNPDTRQPSSGRNPFDSDDDDDNASSRDAILDLS